MPISFNQNQYTFTIQSIPIIHSVPHRSRIFSSEPRNYEKCPSSINKGGGNQDVEIIEVRVKLSPLVYKNK